MVTLAAALALPASFPQRDLVVLTALTVVLGTLVLQGITLGPLIRLLNFPRDATRDEEMLRARALLATAAMDALGDRDDDIAQAIRHELQADLSGSYMAGRDLGGIDALRIDLIRTERETLRDMRREGIIGEEVFRALEQELDLREVTVMRRDSFELVDN